MLEHQPTIRRGARAVLAGAAPEAGATEEHTAAGGAADEKVETQAPHEVIPIRTEGPYLEAPRRATGATPGRRLDRRAPALAIPVGRDGIGASVEVSILRGPEFESPGADGRLVVALRRLEAHLRTRGARLESQGAFGFGDSGLAQPGHSGLAKAEVFFEEKAEEGALGRAVPVEDAGVGKTVGPAGVEALRKGLGLGRGILRSGYQDGAEQANRGGGKPPPCMERSTSWSHP